MNKLVAPLFIALSLLLTICFTSYAESNTNRTDNEALKAYITETIEADESLEVKNIVINQDLDGKCTVTVTVGVSVGVVSLSVAVSITADTCEEAAKKAASEAKAAAATVEAIFSN